MPPLVLNALDARSTGELACPALGCDLQFEPCDILGGHPGGPAHHLAAHRAAVDEFPIRSRKVSANRFAVDHECRDRLAKLPGERACGVRLAFVNLGAFSV